MSDGGRRPDEDAFAEAMRDVERIDKGRRRGSRRGGGGGPGWREAAGAPPTFRVERLDNRIYALRRDAPAARLAELRSGDLRPANRLDLHGVSEEAAREMVFRFVRQARSSGLAAVAVVHGRGLRSAVGPVLKKALPRWLTELPLSRAILAFASAPADQGGDGVTLIALAPPRRGGR